MDFPDNAKQMLNVVPYLVSDDIGLGKISRGLKSCLQLPEKTQINIQSLVGTAIKRTGGRTCHSTCRPNTAGKQHQGGFAITVKQGVPYIFRISKNYRRKLGQLFFLSGGHVTAATLFYANTPTARRAYLLQKRQWIHPHDPTRDYNHDDESDPSL